MNCPQCGAGFDWQARFSQLVVCSSCSSAIVVDEQAARVAGQMSTLAQTPGPLYVGATGHLQRHPEEGDRGRKRRFLVMGRVRYSYANGFWDEWYCAEPDGSAFWVGEDEGELTLTQCFERHLPDSFWERAQPGSRISFGEHSYLVQEADVASCEGGEGQLPFVVLPGEQYAFVELAAPGGQFVTVERGASPTAAGSASGDRVFRGRHIDAAAFVLDIEKPEPSAAAGPSGGHQVHGAGEQLGLSCFACGGALETKGATSGSLDCPYCGTANDLGGDKLQCPSCGEGVVLAAGDQVQMVVCPSCQAQIDTSDREPALIGAGASAVVSGGDGTFRVGQRCKFDGLDHVITGHLKLRTVDSWGEYFSHEYLVYSPKRGYRWLGEEDGHFNLIEQVKDPPPEMSLVFKGKTKWGGETWRCFERDNEEIVFVNGQLPYVARVGDHHSYVDHIAPPKKLTAETTASEREYFLAEYLDRKDVAAAFSVDEDELPEPEGVAANQPFRRGPLRRSLIWQMAAVGLLNLVLYFAAGSMGRVVAIVPIEASELQSDVSTEPVVFKKRMVRAEFVSSPKRSLNPGYATVTVLDETGNAVADFSAQWRDKTTQLFRLPNPGAYRFKINAQAKPATALKVSFREGVLLGRYFILLALGMFAWVLFEWLHKRSFEARRWSEVDDE